MPYRYVDDWTAADVAFEAWGNSLEELFSAAADATLNAMVDHVDAVQMRSRREFTVTAEALDLVLFNFLGELIYYKDCERLLLRVRELEVRLECERYTLKAVTMGERLDPKRHAPRVDVKAVTLHRFALENTGSKWVARVILDV